MKLSIEGFNQAYALSLRKEIKVTKNNDETTKMIKIDCIDLVILRWFVDFYPKMKTIEVEGIKYVWLTHKKLQNDLPLIDISKRAFMERMQKLVEFNILEYKLLKENGTFSLYKFGDNYENLIKDNKNLPEQNNNNSKNENEYQTNEQKSKENRDTLLLEFEEVWSFYPKKQGKKEALDFYIKARKEGIEKDTIINSIKKYVEYIKTTGWQQYRDGSRWFRNKGWEDDWNISNDSQFEENEETIRRVIDYMNDCYNRNDNFKVEKTFNFYNTTISTKKIISDRIKEGYTREDFAKVIYNAYDKYVEHEFTAKDGRSSIQFYNPSFIFSSAEMEKNKNEYENV